MAAHAKGILLRFIANAIRLSSVTLLGALCSLWPQWWKKSAAMATHSKICVQKFYHVTLSGLNAYFFFCYNHLTPLAFWCFLPTEQQACVPTEIVGQIEKNNNWQAVMPDDVLMMRLI